MWSVGYGETQRVMFQTGKSRRKSDELIKKALDNLERETAIKR